MQLPPAAGRGTRGAMVSPPPTFETARLVLRPLRLADAGPIFRNYGQDPEVSRFVTWKPHRAVETVEAFLREVVSAPADGPHRHWAITIKGNDEPIGASDAIVDGHGMSIGYTIARSHWGRGYVAEAMLPVVEWGLAQPNIHRVWAVCDVDNPRSARVMEKLGMQHEGTLRRWNVHPTISDVPRDCHVYARIKE